MSGRSCPFRPCGDGSSGGQAGGACAGWALLRHPSLSGLAAEDAGTHASEAPCPDVPSL